MVKVYIPTSLRKLSGGQTRIDAQVSDVASLLDYLESCFPGFKSQVLDQNGRLHRFVNVYVNDKEIEDLDGLATKLNEEDELAVIPAVAGGSQPFTLEQSLRYARHIILPEIGSVGQRKLLNSRVVIIGAGGLGSPAALYLAAAGVGTLGIVDFDVVDLTNLQRQLLHGKDDVGRPKTESARDTLNRINPDVNVVTHNMALSSENAMEVLSGYDVVVNGCDNFATRYLVNDACVLLKKPLVDGSIFRFEGMTTVYLPGKGCYRCVFPAPPPPGAVPSCAEAGVLGVLPGIIGTIQAIETIKLIVGIGEPLVGRLLLFDSLSMEFREMKLRRDPECPVCGDNPTITQLIDYEEFCGAPMHLTGG